MPQQSILRPCPPHPNHCLCPPKVSKVSFYGKKAGQIERTPCSSLRFCDEHFFYVIQSQIWGQEPSFTPKDSIMPPKRKKSPPQAITVPRTKVADREPREGFAMRPFFSFFLSLTPILRAKLLRAPPKNFFAAQARYTGAGLTSMPTKLAKSAQPNKLIVSIMPIVCFAWYAYKPCLLCLYYKLETTLELQHCGWTYVSLDIQKSVNEVMSEFVCCQLISENT